jgi:alkylated DNA repair dioxygenase AlkB
VAFAQLGLLGDDEPRFDASFAGVRRIELGEGAWLEHLPGWVSGHERLFEAVRLSMRWRDEQRPMYGRVVDVPRLYAIVPDDGPGHPLIHAMQGVLSERYGQAFERVSLSLYRDCRDSVAWHGDRVARNMPEAMVVTVSLGSPRRFLLRPASGGPSRSLDLGWGDLLVMGGTAQRTWQHSVPKVKKAGPRIAIMFRPRWVQIEAEGAKSKYG